MAKSIIVVGPSGCGKTRNAKKIAEFFKLTDIVDPFDRTMAAPTADTLMLTNDTFSDPNKSGIKHTRHKGVTVMQYEDLKNAKIVD